MKKHKKWNDGFAEDQWGSVGSKAYDVNSAALGKFRQLARQGLSALSVEERRAYGEAVEKAVLASQRSALRRVYVEPRPNCASGTWYSDGDDIAKAVRAQNKARATRPGPEKSEGHWIIEYDLAMKEKRAREYSATLMAA